MKKKINIEFGHIYLDEEFNTIHKNSIYILKNIFKKNDPNVEFVTTIMIDDYNSTKKILDIDEMISSIKQMDVLVDFIVYESTLIFFVDKILEIMHPRHKREYEKYIDFHSKIPCSLFIVIFYLFRLDFFKPRYSDIIYNISNTNEELFFSNEIINILPLKFQSVEKKAMEVISKLLIDNNNLLQKINHKFY